MKYSDWYGFKRCDFDFMGHEAFIAEPHKPLAEKNRPYIGHHPHGYDDPKQVVDFITENYRL